MRILMVLDQDFPPDVRVENEALSLIAAGHEVVLWSIAPDDRPVRESYKGITIVRSRLHKEIRNKMRGLAGSFPFYKWYLSRGIAKLHREFSFGAIHVHDLYLVGGGLTAGKKLGLPMVADLHENYVHALKNYAWSTTPPGKWLVSIPRWHKLEKKWLAEARSIVVVIEEARERVLGLDVPEEKLAVVPNTIKIDEFSKYPLQTIDYGDFARDKNIFTYTGGFDVHRGLECLLQGFAAFIAKHPQNCLVLVGAGRTEGSLKELSSSLGIDHAVRFEGWQPQEKIRSYIAASDVCLVPHNRTEHTDATIPHKLFHYMFCGKPVIVSDCKPLKRIVSGTDAGFVFEAGNPANLEIVMEAMLRQKADWSTIGKRGSATVAQRFNWDATVQPLLDLYQNLD